MIRTVKKDAAQIHDVSHVTNSLEAKENITPKTQNNTGHIPRKFLSGFFILQVFSGSRYHNTISINKLHHPMIAYRLKPPVR